MQIPNYEDAHVDQEKLTEYLLSQTHPIGKSKAVWFEILGYNASNWRLLQTDLVQIAAAAVDWQTETRYGHKYGVSGTLNGPNGKSGEVVTVWIIMIGQQNPRLVTAYPDD